MIGARAFIAMSWIFILGEHKSLAAVDGAPSGDDAVARHLGFLHAEFHRAMFDEHVELLE
jgi:hypothetical protein